MSRCGLAAVWPRCGLIFQSAADSWQEKHAEHPEHISLDFEDVQAGTDIIERSEEFRGRPVRWGNTLYKASHRQAITRARCP